MKQNQSGRSMIEMLGVLAIIGVLSVGALYGLRTAQNKYRANAIIADVMLVAADLMPRQEALTANTEITTFSFNPKNALSAEKCVADGNIEVIVENIPQAVCEKVIRNGVIKGTQGIGVARANSTPCDGTSLTSTCTASNDLVFVLGSTREEMCGGKYCEAGFYCRYNSPSGCADKGTGVCTANGERPTATNQIVSLSNGKTVYISPGTMNWWSAKSYCESLGLSALPKATANLTDFWTSFSSSIVANTYAWLSEDYGNNCNAYYVKFSNFVDYGHGRDGGHYALCQE